MMAVSQKRAPSMEDPQLNRTMSKIYDDINDIVNAVNLGETSIEKDEFEGKSGDLKLVKKSDGNYQIRGRTDEGWVFAAMKPSYTTPASLMTPSTRFKVAFVIETSFCVASGASCGIKI